MDQKFLVPIFAVRGAMDQKFMILIIMNFAVWGAMDQMFLIPICWVPDTDQKFLIHINFGICGAMVQKFLVPIFAVRGAMDQIFLIHSCLWNHGLGTFDICGAKGLEPQIPVQLIF